MPMLNERVRRSASTFRGDLRVALPEFLAALLLSGIIFAVFVVRVRAGLDEAAISMPHMVKDGGVWPFSMSQAVGWAALFLSWVTVLLGVTLPVLQVWLVRSARVRLRATLEQIHRSTSLALIGLIAIHAVLLVWDRMGDSLAAVFVPWMYHFKRGRFGVALGIFSLYLAVLVGLSFYLRRRLGVRTWSLLHRYVIPAVYGLAVWHTFYGSDVKDHNGLWMLVWVMQIPVVVGFGIRIVAPMRRHRRERRRALAIDAPQRTS